LQLGYIQNITK